MKSVRMPILPAMKMGVPQEQVDLRHELSALGTGCQARTVPGGCHPKTASSGRTHKEHTPSQPNKGLHPLDFTADV
jgi:hypothetical protein